MVGEWVTALINQENTETADGQIVSVANGGVGWRGEVWPPDCPTVRIRPRNENLFIVPDSWVLCRCPYLHDRETFPLFEGQKRPQVGAWVSAFWFNVGGGLAGGQPGDGEVLSVANGGASWPQCLPTVKIRFRDFVTFDEVIVPDSWVVDEAPRPEREDLVVGSFVISHYYQEGNKKSSQVDDGQIKSISPGASEVDVLFQDDVLQTVPFSFLVHVEVPEGSFVSSAPSEDPQAARKAEAEAARAQERQRRAEEAREKAEAARREAERRAQEAEARAKCAEKNDNYYEVLGVKPGCSDEEIKEAYKTLVRCIHPDKHNTKGNAVQSSLTRYFRQVNEAYETLRYPEKRAEYDKKLGFGASSSTGQQPVKVGDEVRLVGLNKAAVHNGKSGVVTENCGNGRLRVKLTFGTQLDVKPENLQKL